MNRAARRTLSLPVLILAVTAAAAGLASPAGFAVGADPVPPPSCAEQSSAIAAAGQATLNPAAAAATTTSVFDDLGQLTGHRLDVPTANEDGLSVVLPAESSVSPPQGDLIVYTRHSAETGSEVRALNVRTGCDALLARPSEIVRSAILDETAAGVYIHSVTRTDRADFGVQRHDLGTSGVTWVVPAFVAPEAFGPIFGTELRRSVGGEALVVQSCGFAQCVTRVLDHAAGTLAAFNFANQGQLIGATRSHLITYAGCHGLPCPVLSVDVASGSVTTLAEDAFDATLAHAEMGNGRLTIETADGFVGFDQ